MKHIVDSDWIVPAPTPTELSAVAALLHKHSGIVLAAGKASMVQARLSKRIKSLGLRNFGSYIDLLHRPGPQGEVPHLISALTTNVTHFFRERHHFDLLAKKILPEVLQKNCPSGNVRIWSAGCSKGHEAYSIAMTVLESVPSEVAAKTKIIATDIDKKIIDFARRGSYTSEDLLPVADALRKKYFSPKENRFEVKPNLRRMVTFQELNLNEEWPQQKPYDIIFCRNVVIYFSLETQAKLWKKFQNSLSSGGWLLIGHSERIPNGDLPAFSPVDVTTYRLLNP